jgi:hypothetical protein
MRGIARAACALIGIWPPYPITAHERWSDGSPIPEWVNRYCCGVADAHRLRVGQIHRIEGGWLVEGYNRVVPDDRVMLSQDENVWLFYGTMADGSQTEPICFFVPQGSI